MLKWIAENAAVWVPILLGSVLGSALTFFAALLFWRLKSKAEDTNKAFLEASVFLEDMFTTSIERVGSGKKKISDRDMNAKLQSSFRAEFMLYYAGHADEVDAFLDLRKKAYNLGFTREGVEHIAESNMLRKDLDEFYQHLREKAGAIRKRQIRPRAWGEWLNEKLHE